MKLHDYVDKAKLAKYVEDGYISVRQHPSIPSLFVYNYTASAQFENHWPHEVCACRGLIVDADDNIIARPMYKFFNLGQKSTIFYGSHRNCVVQDVMVDAQFLAHEASQKVDLMSPFVQGMTITRKMDGMMGVLWNYDGQWGISTRGSFSSEGAVFATQKWQKFVKYGATEFVPKGWTLIFEIIAKHLRIVVPYEWEGLCLLTAVNNETGEEMSYQQLQQVWQDINQYAKTTDAEGNLVPGKPWCRLVEKFDISLEQAREDQSKEEEGYVVSVNRKGAPPIKAKVKLAEYLRLHKLLCNVNPQAIWKELAHPMAPWIDTECKWDFVNKQQTVSMQVPAEFREWIQGWQRGLTDAFHEKLVKAVGAVAYMEAQAILFNERCRNDKERKEILVGTYGKEISGYAMQLRNGKITEAYQSIWDSVRPFGKEETFYHEGQGE